MELQNINFLYDADHISYESLSNTNFEFNFKDSFGFENGSKPRSMDRLRRSLRASIRKKKNKDPWTDTPQTSTTGGSRLSSDGGKPHQWQSDEISVRAGTCNFHVKVSNKFIWRFS